MSVALWIFVAAAQASAPPVSVQPIISAPVPPPPIISTAVPSPPVIVPMAPSPPSKRPVLPPTDIDIKVTAGNRTLYADSLRVDAFTGASYSQMRTEAGSIKCDSIRPRSANNSLNVRLNRMDWTGTIPSLSVDVSWNRPTAENSCESTGTRLVTMSQTIALVPGKTVRLDGDAGLRVELTPR